jgi:translation initiation factor 3 subunit B
VAKNLRQYSKRYDEEDEAVMAAADSEFLAERARVMAEWRDWRAGREAWAAEQAAFAREALGARWRPDEEQFTLREVEVSAVVEAREEPAKLH